MDIKKNIKKEIIKRKSLFKDKKSLDDEDLEKILLEDAYDDFSYYLQKKYCLTPQELKEIIKEYLPELLI